MVRPLPLAGIGAPGYDRSGLATGIVHIGVGNFHRSHQAAYIDRLLASGGHRAWGICGVGLLPSDARVRDALRTQDGRYTLVLKHPDGTLEPHVIGSVCDFLFAPDDPWAVVDRLADPSTRIVSLTITEGGYTMSDDPGDAAVVADAQPGAVPTTVFGVVVHALRRRRDAGLAPFTVMSCDNIENNGDVARGSDTVARLCAFSSDRIPKWLLPVVRDNLLLHGGRVRLSAAVVASWARYLEGVDEQGRPISIVDRRRLRSGAGLITDSLFGDLRTEPEFVDAFSAVLDDIHALGVRAALDAALAR